MIDYFNIAGGFIQSYPIPDDLSGWRIATPDDYESLRVSDWPAAIASRRYEAEVSGITVAGMQIDTDDRSKLLINGAAVEAMLDPEYRMQWKTPAGFVELSAAQVLGVARAVRAHVQACFDREADLLAMGDAVTLDDLATGWPEI